MATQPAWPEEEDAEDVVDAPPDDVTPELPEVDELAAEELVALEEELPWEELMREALLLMALALEELAALVVSSAGSVTVLSTHRPLVQVPVRQSELVAHTPRHTPSLHL